MSAILVLTLGLLQETGLEAEVSRLVRELEQESIDVRDRAQESLIRLGRRAEALLRAQMKEAPEEVRSRIEVVLREIERRERIRDVYAEPAPITLEFESVPLSRVLEALSKQTRTTVVAEPEAAGETVTVKCVKTPVFRAVDDLCRAHGNLTYAIACAAGHTTVTIKRGKYVAHPRLVEERFVVWLDSIVLSVRSDLRGGSAGSGAMTFESGWESGNVPIRTHLRLTEVLDDRGRSCLSLVSDEGRKSSEAITRHEVELEGVPSEDAKKLSVVRGVLEVTFPTDVTLLRFEGPANRVGATLSENGFQAALSDYQVGEEFVRLTVRVFGNFGSAGPRFRLRDKSGKELSPQHTSTIRSRGSVTYSLRFVLPKGGEVGAFEVGATTGSLERSVRFEFRDVPIRP